MKTETLPHFNGQGPHRYEDGECVYCGKSETVNDVVAEYADLYRIALTWTDNKSRARLMVEAYFQGRLQQP